MRKKSIVTSLVLLILAVPAWAGVVFEVETTHHTSSGTETTEAMVEGKNIKMEINADSDGGQGDMIYRGDRREMVVIDHQEQSYIVMDEATAREIGGQVSGAMKQVEEALKNVPEDQRALVEQMMKKQLGALQQPTSERPPTELKKTGERAEKNGYPCVEYEVWVGGQKIRELWVTDWSNIEGGQDVEDAFTDMSGFFEELLDSFASVSGMGGLGDQIQAQNLFAQFKEIDGFPVVTREFEGGELESESILRSAQRRTLDPDAFEPPKGYRLRSMSPQ